MATTPLDTPLYWLHRPVIERVLEDRCWTQEALADEVGLSRVHFNRLLNGRRPLTRRSRRKLMDCPILAGFAPGELWRSSPDEQG